MGTTVKVPCHALHDGGLVVVGVAATLSECAFVFPDVKTGADTTQCVQDFAVSTVSPRVLDYRSHVTLPRGDRCPRFPGWQCLVAVENDTLPIL